VADSPRSGGPVFDLIQVVPRPRGIDFTRIGMNKRGQELKGSASFVFTNQALLVHPAQSAWPRLLEIMTLAPIIIKEPGWFAMSVLEVFALIRIISVSAI
jgi:hypothetical protein